MNELQNLIKVPESTSTEYGSHAVLTTNVEYRLEQFVVGSGKSFTLAVESGEDATAFVEEGSFTVGSETLSEGKLAQLAQSSNTKFEAAADTTLYVFFGPSTLEAGTPVKIGPTADARDKYWGKIETMVNEEYTGKRLFFAKGQHSSLHFHCNKTETYYIHRGELLVRLRAGRGEDKSFTLKKGDTLLIPPGLMHQDGGVEDTVIIEISTHDEDSDSFIVEDGATTEMPGFGS